MSPWGGTSNVVVSDNSSGTSTRLGRPSDAIQFWTRNTKVAAHDISVTGNVIERGKGEAIQGIFFRDQSRFALETSPSPTMS
jgi:hypothetical protein